MFDPVGIPPELRVFPQWVCWRYEWRGERWTKVPISPHGGGSELASVTDSRTWGTWDCAGGTAWRRQLGVGFVLTADDPVVGIDLDHCGTVPAACEMVVHPSVAWIPSLLRTYTEWSPSGSGLRMFAFGALPSGRRRAGNIEIYDRGRFLTVTGRLYTGSSSRVEWREEHLVILHRLLFPERLLAPIPSVSGAVVDELADEEVLRLVCRGKQAAAFVALWAGNWGGYASHSEADLALCRILGFFCRGNSQQVDRLFRQSGLYRWKWDRDRGDRTYGARTLDVALGSLAAVYEPPKERVVEVW